MKLQNATNVPKIGREFRMTKASLHTLKGVGYLISTVSATLLAIVGWSSASKSLVLAACLIGGATLSIIGMFCRGLTSRCMILITGCRTISRLGHELATVAEGNNDRVKVFGLQRYLALLLHRPRPPRLSPAGISPASSLSFDSSPASSSASKSGRSRSVSSPNSNRNSFVVT